MLLQGCSFLLNSAFHYAIIAMRKQVPKRYHFVQKRKRYDHYCHAYPGLG